MSNTEVGDGMSRISAEMMKIEGVDNLRRYGRLKMEGYHT